MNKSQGFIEWLKKFPDWIKGAIGLVTLIISFLLLIQQNASLGITVSIALLLIVTLCASLYVAFSRTPPLVEGGRGVYSFPKYRSVALAGIAIVPLVAITLLGIRHTRRFALEALSTKTEKGSITIEQLLPLTSAYDYRIEVTVRNSASHDVLAKKLIISGYYENELIAGCAYYVYNTFRISDTFQLVRIDGTKMEVVGKVSTQEHSLYSYPVHGYFGNGCGTQTFELQFDTALVLPANKHASFHLLLPISLHAYKQDGEVLSFDLRRLDFYDDLVIEICLDAQSEPILHGKGKARGATFDLKECRKPFQN